MADVLSDKPVKSFYHSSITNKGKMQHYLTPLERKAIRDIRSIELENKFLDTTPMKDEKENIKSKKVVKKRTNRQLHLKCTGSAKENMRFNSTPKKLAVRKYNWAPKSMHNKRYSKENWLSQAKSFSASPKLKSILNLSYDNLNKSLPSISNNFSQDEDLKSSSFSVECDKDEEIEEGPPAKMRKTDAEDDVISSARSSQVAEQIEPSKKQQDTNQTNKDDASKFYPIFNQRSGKRDERSEESNKKNDETKLLSPMTPENLSSTIAGNQNTKIATRKTSPPQKQMIIDAGQKRFGATQCSMCGMIYSANHPNDEQEHVNYHKRFLNFVKFLGWKNERIVASFMDGRIIKVTSNDPKYAVKKVSDILTIVDIDLGFKTVKAGLGSSKVAYFFISDSEKITGCLIAEKISAARRLIPCEDTQQSSAKTVLCFTDTEFTPAVCGISRIWTYGPMRRKKIATRLLDAARQSFVLGCCLDKNQVAFSDPTPDGRAFASKYFNTPNILVYNFLR